MEFFETRKIKTIFKVLFILYLVLLIKVILFKYPLFMTVSMFKESFNTPFSTKLMYSNFMPFKTISYYLAGKPSLSVAKINLIGNIIAFIPFGAIVPVLFKKFRSMKFTILFSFLLSLLFEIIQLLTSIGAFDVDDIMLNVIGAILGYIIFKIFYKIIENKEKNS